MKRHQEGRDAVLRVEVTEPPKKRRGPRKGMAAEKTRADLLRAAGEAMIDKGSVDISLADVGQRTGLSAPLIQYHFGSKEGLLLALIERDAAQAVGMMEELAAMPLPPDRKMRMHIEGFVKSFFRAPYLNLLLHVHMQGSGEAVANRVSDVFVKPIVEFQRQVLSDGVAQGIFRPVEPMYFYFIIVGACEHMFARRGALRQVFGIESISDDVRAGYSQAILDTVFKGILIDRDPQ